MIRFAIVTPSYNQGRYLERSICSVLQQGYPKLEYAICDGASSDQTPLILSRYAKRARIIAEPDRGQAHAVNKGILATSGDVIGWLNSDDVYCPGALLTVAGYFANHPHVDVVYGDADVIDADDRVIGRYYTEPWDAQRLPTRPFLCQPAVFFRRSVVERFGLLDETLHYTLDYEYWLRLAHHAASFVYLPYTLAQARHHAETKTRTHGMRLHNELNTMLRRYVRHVPDAWILTQTHDELRQRRDAFKNPFVFALAVIRVSWRRSLQLNRRVSMGMVRSSIRTLSSGAVKTALGLPIVMPTE